MLIQLGNMQVSKLANGASTGQSPAKTEPVKQGVNPMYVDYVSSDKHNESAKTNYLLSRFQDTKGKVNYELRKQFGLENDERPQSAKEFADRILSGKYILPTETEETLSRAQYYCGWSVTDSIKWRDPEIKEDRAGYEAAKKQLDDAATDVHDCIMLKSNDEALKEIKALESWKPGKKAKAS